MEDREFETQWTQGSHQSAIESRNPENNTGHIPVKETKRWKLKVLKKEENFTVQFQNKFIYIWWCLWQRHIMESLIDWLIDWLIDAVSTITQLLKGGYYYLKWCWSYDAGILLKKTKQSVDEVSLEGFMHI